MSENDTDGEKMQIYVFKSHKEGISKVIELNPEKYSSASHFVRVAIIKLLQQEGM